MAKYLVTFRLRDNPTYGRRYDALHEVLDEHGTGFWVEGTSFIAMETNLSITGLGNKLKAAIDAATDFLMIREIDVKNTVYVGSPEDGFLYFFPDAKKL